MITTAVLVLLILALCSLILLSTRPRGGHGKPTLLVSLGSGGHTSEMLQMMQTIDTTSFTRMYYISSGDTHSLHKVRAIEGSAVSYRTVTRARKVKQSWLTTPFTTLIAFIHALQLLQQDNPQLILVNGPGTCVLIVIAARILALLRLNSKTRVIFIESFARVNTLSLSGRILLKLRLTDRFLVMWKGLERYPGVEYTGFLI